MTLKRKSPKLNPQLQKLPPYLFAELGRKKREALARGADLINLGIGDPDLPTPDFIVKRMAEAVKKAEHHQYPEGKGSLFFRESVARFMKKKYGVALDCETQIVALIGSKEGIGHLPLALAGPGDKVLVPDPGYPPYFSGAVFANAKPIPFPLLEKNAFLPDFKTLPAKARLLHLNYPNNPTGATAPLSFFGEAVKWAQKSGAWVAHDAAYAEAFLDGVRPPSILQAAGALERSIEFHSLSKTFNMTGWRVGWACGSAEAVSALAEVKNHLDSGVFTAVQEAAAHALDHGDEAAEEMRRVQQGRRKLFTDGLRKAGWSFLESAATFYVWCRTPGGLASADCAARLLDEAELVATPGNGFGAAGEGYIRFALTVPEKRLRLALERIGSLRW